MTISAHTHAQRLALMDPTVLAVQLQCLSVFYAMVSVCQRTAAQPTCCRSTECMGKLHLIIISWVCATCFTSVPALSHIAGILRCFPLFSWFSSQRAPRGCNWQLRSCFDGHCCVEKEAQEHLFALWCALFVECGLPLLADLSLHARGVCNHLFGGYMHSIACSSCVAGRGFRFFHSVVTHSRHSACCWRLWGGYGAVVFLGDSFLPVGCFLLRQDDLCSEHSPPQALESQRIM